MAFTLSHPALVLPLRRSGLPMAALVCGSMTPDLHMAVPRLADDTTHSWSNVPTIDLLLGMALTAGWVFAIGPTVMAALPGPLRERVGPLQRFGPSTWLLAVAGVLLGVASHIGWDTFTHYDMWGGENIAWMRQDHYGMAGFNIAQYGSSAVGLIVLVLWSGILLARRRARPVAAHPRRVAARVALVAPSVVALALSALAGLWLVSRGWAPVRSASTTSLRLMLVLGTFGITLGSLAWVVGERGGRAPAGTTAP